MSSLSTIWRRRLADPSRRAGSLRRTRSVHDGRPFTPLIDAREAGALLGVPHTWLLAQARAGRVPHHRLGHYVRFNPEDLREWLRDTRIGPARLDHRGGH
jgi:excisionase family DNA binding protein